MQIADANAGLWSSIKSSAVQISDFRFQMPPHSKMARKNKRENTDFRFQTTKPVKSGCGGLYRFQIIC